MHGHIKLDVAKALKLRAQGLSNAIIAKRLDITTGAVYAAFRKYDEQNGVPENSRLRRRPFCWT
jgi:DNA-binding CsgD family transcriptional regulator